MNQSQLIEIEPLLSTNSYNHSSSMEMNEFHNKIESNPLNDNKKNSTSIEIKSSGGKNIYNEFSMDRVILCSVFGCWSSINFGYSLGYPAYHSSVLKKSHTTNSDAKISLYESILLIGALFGALIATYGLMSRYGRKTSITVSAIFSLTGWILHLPFSSVSISSKFSIIHLLIFARFLVGIGVGIGSTASPVYAAEISPPSAFKYTGGLHQIGITIGFIILNLVNYITEKYDSAEIGAISNCTTTRLYLPLVILIIVIIQLISSLFLPYVPTWLATWIAKHKLNEELLLKNNIKLYKSEYQLDKISQLLSNDNKNSNQSTNKSIYNRQNLYAFITVVMLFLFQQMSGINPVVFNASKLFKKVGLTSDTLGSLVASFGQFFGALLCAVTNAYVPKKVTLITASLTCTLTHFILGIQSQFLSENTKLAPISVTMVFLFYIAFNASWGPIPFIYNAFSYSSEAVGVFSGLGVMLSWLFSFAITYPYFQLQAALKIHGTFYFFSVFSILAALFSFLVVPEIKTKDITEVPSLFKRFLHPTLK